MASIVDRSPKVLSRRDQVMVAWQFYCLGYCTKNIRPVEGTG
jgi:hypothetical protein